MKNFLDKILLFPFLLGLYFPISIISQNLREIDLRTIPRSLIIVLLVSLLLISLFYILLKSWQKSALITALLMFAFFFYGLIYSLLKQPVILGGNLGRHRIQLPIFVLSIVLLIYKIVRHKNDFGNFIALLNLLGIFLCLINLINWGVFWWNRKSRQVAPISSDEISTSVQSSRKNLPDVYFIVLDAYDRQDYLLKNFQFDNSAFINELRRLGFFVADCSRPNYAHTILSLSSTLNMEYVQNFDSELLNDNGLTDKLIHSRVRELLEARGYLTVTYANVHWNFSDADVFFDFPNPFFSPYLQPIEGMMLENSLMRALVDLSPKLRNLLSDFLISPVKNHYQQQLSIINLLPEARKVASPKFVFAHIEKPHGPFVFDLDGSFLKEDAYYRDIYYAAINREYFKSGYIKQIEFLNLQMLKFFTDLLNNSDPHPIIILEGDHGIGEEQDIGSRVNNLLAVYFPDQNYHQLYENITPINIFRVIFSQYFGKPMPLLADKTYYSAKEFRLDFQEEIETMPSCIE